MSSWLPPALEDFRARIRTFIAVTQPSELASLTNWNARPTSSVNERIRQAESHPAYREWEERLLEERLVCPQWPAEVGGQGLSAAELAVLNEEFFTAGVPRVRRGMGESLVGPSVIVHGTDEQRARLLPRIIRGEDRYCEGFSEPAHGSDLAAIETRGEVVGDEIVITGQKVWTSRAHFANMMFVLCRTDPAAPKHDGLSFVLVPLEDNGFEIVPIREMSGGTEFCEDFIEGARAPVSNVIGGLNNGWRVAMTTLANERGAQATVQHLPYEQELWALVDLARENGKVTDPVVRQELARAFCRIQVLRYLGLQQLGAILKGAPAPRTSSLTKLLRVESHRRLGEIAMDIAGAGAMIRPDGEGYPTTRWQDLFLWSRSSTIAGGTSEVQRNIVAERDLGLPKERSAE